MAAVRTLAILFVLASVPQASPAQDSTQAARLSAALDRIPAHLAGGNAEEVEDSLTAILRVLYQYPALSAQLLVARLEPTARGRHRDHPAVVWYIRALRSLTGLDFSAATTTQLSDSEASYIGRDSAGNVRLFGWHMAWDVTWLAPGDAQRAIIRKWRAWDVKEGSGFNYVNDPAHEHWYF